MAAGVKKSKMKWDSETERKNIKMWVSYVENGIWGAKSPLYCFQCL